jgi:ADP-ribosylglycohydrolase
MTPSPNPVPDRAAGALLGHAIGDALGLGTEFLSRERVRAWYPDGLHDYAQIVRDGHRSKWRPGEATDDTGQMLALAGVLAALRPSLPAAPSLEADLARALDAWLRRDPRGVGKLTVRVLCDPRFTADPLGVAGAIHAKLGERAASNGSVMRLTPVGVVCWRAPHHAVALAARTSHVTHTDPRCVDACRVVSWAVARLTAGVRREEVLAELQAVAQLEETRAHVARARATPPGELGLDEGTRYGEENRMGYVGLALAAGVSALAHAGSFEEGLLAVVHAGGDADTNGAVAGGILGAWCGAGSIPGRWLEGLADAEACRGLAAELVEGFADPAG